MPTSCEFVSLKNVSKNVQLLKQHSQWRNGEMAFTVSANANSQWMNGRKVNAVQH